MTSRPWDVQGRTCKGTDRRENRPHARSLLSLLAGRNGFRQSGTHRALCSASLKKLTGSLPAVEQLDTPDAILSLGTRVYEGFSPEQIDSIEQHCHQGESFFEES